VGKDTPPIEVRWIFYGEPENPVRLTPGETLTFTDDAGPILRIERDEGNTLRIFPLRLMVALDVAVAERHAAQMRAHG
jgi:hypothetical protein